MKNLFTESLDIRLLKYSLAAGAVLFGAKESNAQVIHRDTTLNNVSDFSINFDGNSSPELHIRAYYSASCAVATSDVDVMVGKVKGYNSGGYYHIGSALNSNASIGPGGSFATGTENWFAQRVAWHNNSPWKGADHKFLGVRFTGKDGQAHYGWVRLSCSATQGGTGGYLLSVYDFAYETQANTAINSGALPVELTTFTANNLREKVELKWNTATEVNNYGFEIQRSESNVVPGGVEGWGKIGFVKGSGNSNSPKTYSFIDENPLSGKAEYRLKQIDNDGQFVYSKTVEVTTKPTQFSLEQNYPNPFNPTTTIKYSIPKAEHVTLIVYDEIGREVSTLVNENKSAGNYSVQFKISGRQLTSGIYYYRISAGEFNEVKKLMLLK